MLYFIWSTVQWPHFLLISGGPGSRKGRVVDDLMTSYGFNFICGEEVIRTELVKRVRAAVKCETIQDVRNLLDVSFKDADRMQNVML